MNHLGLLELFLRPNSRATGYIASSHGVDQPLKRKVLHRIDMPSPPWAPATYICDISGVGRAFGYSWTLAIALSTKRLRKRPAGRHEGGFRWNYFRGISEQIAGWSSSSQKRKKWCDGYRPFPPPIFPNDPSNPLGKPSKMIRWLETRAYFLYTLHIFFLDRQVIDDCPSKRTSELAMKVAKCS